METAAELRASLYGYWDFQEDFRNPGRHRMNARELAAWSEARSAEVARRRSQLAVEVRRLADRVNGITLWKLVALLETLWSPGDAPSQDVIQAACAEVDHWVTTQRENGVRGQAPVGAANNYRVLFSPGVPSDVKTMAEILAAHPDVAKRAASRMAAEKHGGKAGSIYGRYDRLLKRKDIRFELPTR